MPPKRKLPYGFKINSNGNVALNESEANAIRLIFSEYLRGKSLGGICNTLEQAGTLSPQGKPKWNRTSVDNILTRGSCLHGIIPFEQFCDAQYERQRRSNINEDTNKRKTTRYSSQNVLSGLLICGGCGSSYRRITRNAGEFVWRCADRVEHGKRSACRSRTVTEQEYVGFLCEVLGLEQPDEAAVRDNISSVTVDESGKLHAVCHDASIQEFEAVLL